jgi:hypothetical protein
MKLGVVAILMISAVGHADAQGTPSDDPGRLLSAYLYHRQLVTHERPVVVMCGPQAGATVTPELRVDVIGRQRLADSIRLVADCPAFWPKVVGRTYPVVRVTSVTIQADTSSIEAYAEPFTDGKAPYMKSRHERFLMVEGRRHPDGLYTPAQPSLIIFEFAPED